jgi:hypothetical protein
MQILDEVKYYIRKYLCSARRGSGVGKHLSSLATKEAEVKGSQSKDGWAKA